MNTGLTIAVDAIRDTIIRTDEFDDVRRHGLNRRIVVDQGRVDGQLPLSSHAKLQLRGERPGHFHGGQRVDASKINVSIAFFVTQSFAEGRFDELHDVVATEDRRLCCGCRWSSRDGRDTTRDESRVGASFKFSIYEIPGSSHGEGSDDRACVKVDVRAHGRDGRQTDTNDVHHGEGSNAKLPELGHKLLR